MALSMPLAEFFVTVPGHDEDEQRIAKAMDLLEKAGIKSVATFSGADCSELKLPLTGPGSDGNAGKVLQINLTLYGVECCVM